jgi:type IV secretory pathway VirB2 component (pilin)
MNIFVAIIAIIGSAATMAFGRKSWSILKGEKDDDRK